MVWTEAEIHLMTNIQTSPRLAGTSKQGTFKPSFFRINFLSLPRWPRGLDFKVVEEEAF